VARVSFVFFKSAARCGMSRIGASRGCRADASERRGVFGIPDARFTPLPATVGRSPRTALLPTRRGRDARKWDRRLTAQTGGPCHSPKSSSSGGARPNSYERKVPELRRVRGKGGIFLRPTSPRPTQQPTTRRGHDATNRGRREDGTATFRTDLGERAR